MNNKHYFIKSVLLLFIIGAFMLQFPGVSNAESVTQEAYIIYDSEKQVGSSAYGYVDGNTWQAVYNQVEGQGGVEKRTIWYSPDGENFYSISGEKQYIDWNYQYKFSYNDQTLYEGKDAVISDEILGKLYDNKLTKTIYSGEDAVDGQTFDGPVEVSEGAVVAFKNCQFNFGMINKGKAVINNGLFEECTVKNEDEGITYLEETTFRHRKPTTSFLGEVEEGIVSIKIESNGLTVGKKGEPYEHTFIFPDFDYRYFEHFLGRPKTETLYYDSVSIIGKLPDGIEHLEASMHDDGEKVTKLTIKGTPSEASLSAYVFAVRLKESMTEWDVTIPMNIVIEPKTYKVEWKNYDGTVLETDEDVFEGSTPEFNGETPVKTGTNQYSYEFAGWTPELSEVTDNCVYTAKYNQKLNEYAVKFCNDDGSVISEKNYAYGTAAADIEKPEDPVKPDTGEVLYDFIGWTPEIADVTGEAVYTAQYHDFAYKFEEKNGIEWKKDSGKDLNLTVKRSFADDKTFAQFTKVLIDGEELTADSYEIVAGSLKLKLKVEYLKTLDAGVHSVEVKFADGSADMEINVVASEAPKPTPDPKPTPNPKSTPKPTPTPDSKNTDSAITTKVTETVKESNTKGPNTGDNTNIYLLSAVFIVSLCGLAVIFVLRKRYQK